MNEIIEILLANVNRIKTAECAGDVTVARLETEAFQATLGSYLRNGRIQSQVTYDIFYGYLADFSAKFAISD